MADVPLMSNPMTTAGDVLYGGASGIPTRLPVGTAGHVLKVNAGATAPEWIAETAGGGEFTESNKVTLTTGDLSTGSTSFIDATGLTITMTTAAVRCLVIFQGCVRNSAASNTAVDLAIDGTRQGQTFGLQLVSAANASNVVGSAGFTFMTDVLTAASHTFKIQWRVDAGTGTLFASTTITPAILTVIETSMTT